MPNLADHPKFERREDSGKRYLVARIQDERNFDSLEALAPQIREQYPTIVHTTEFHIRVFFPGDMSEEDAKAYLTGLDY
jgi:hypothetical protein